VTTRPNAPHLEVTGLTKRFDGRTVLSQIDFSAASGEVVALVGPSGSGKTTLLRCVAGFETPDAGRVLVGGDDVTQAPPERRNFGMVFQNYALFPHLSVGRNVSFGLEEGRRPRPGREEIAERVRDVLAWVKLSGSDARRIGELSGGMQQRVALARAVAPRPRLLLLDEPLSNLDPSLRDSTRRELRTRVHELSITTLLVTHEQDEAFELADRVAVLEGGRLHQIGRPEELHRQPASAFVARFIGRSTAVEARRVAAGRVAWAGAEWPVQDPACAGAASGIAVELFLRPEGLRLAPTSAEAAAVAGSTPSVEGRVVARRFGSPLATFRVAVPAAGGAEIEVLAPYDVAAEEAAVRLTLEPSAPHPFAFPSPA
jgi:ABC-type Fe3+/spermidine/putrescine transport system ATPase subunit